MRLLTYSYGYDKGGNRTFEQMGNQSQAAYHNMLNQLTATAGAGPMLFKGEATKPLKEATVAGVSATVTGSTFEAMVPTNGGTQTLSVQAKDWDGNTETMNFQVTALAGQARTYTYDKNGNLLNDTERSYLWDSENRLVRINYLSSATHAYTTFGYNGAGQRLKILEADDQGFIQDRRFVWSDQAQPVLETDAVGNPVKRFFGQGVQVLSGASAGNYLYVRDHLGSIRNVLNSSGVSVANYDYSLYGKRTTLSGTFDADFGYTGHFQHEPSGLALTLYRGYSPLLGRWISRDPLGEAGGSNLYAYVGGDPVGNVDPLGLSNYHLLPTANGDGSITYSGIGGVGGGTYSLEDHARLLEAGLNTAGVVAAAAGAAEGVAALVEGRRLLGLMRVFFGGSGLAAGYMDATGQEMDANLRAFASVAGLGVDFATAENARLSLSLGASVWSAFADVWAALRRPFSGVSGSTGASCPTGL